MSLRCLRSDLPEAYSFTVTALPYRAKLDQNETAVDLPIELKRELAAELMAQPWNRYVQPGEYAAAKAELAASLAVDADMLALTAGCDQAIESAFVIGGGPGRRARWFEPTYPYIAHAARRTFTDADAVVLGADIDGALDADMVLAGPAPDLVVLVSPNNPTGGLVAAPVVEAALEDPRRLVFVDEAYADFSGHSFAGLLADHDNLLIGRSLSKSSLAAVHVGYVLGHGRAIAAIERMLTAPYHVNALQILMARRYRDIAPHVRAMARSVVAERERIHDALAAREGVTPRPSRANFVLFGIAGLAERARQVHQALARAGVRVRDVGALPGLAGYLRVTVGTRAENDLFLAAMDQAL
jgi:histidinol-phosphate aminotransferase